MDIAVLMYFGENFQRRLASNIAMERLRGKNVRRHVIIKAQH